MAFSSVTFVAPPATWHSKSKRESDGDALVTVVIKKSPTLDPWPLSTAMIIAIDMIVHIVITVVTVDDESTRGTNELRLSTESCHRYYCILPQWVYCLRGRFRISRTKSGSWLPSHSCHDTFDLTLSILLIPQQNWLGGPMGVQCLGHLMRGSQLLHLRYAEDRSLVHVTFFIYWASKSKTFQSRDS